MQVRGGELISKLISGRKCGRFETKCEFLFQKLKEAFSKLLRFLPSIHVVQSWGEKQNFHNLFQNLTV